MGDLLFKIGDYLLSSSIKTALSGAGLSIITYKGMDIAVTSLFDQAVNYMKSSDLEMPLQLMALGGIDTCISITLSAILVRLSIIQANLYFGKI